MKYPQVVSMPSAVSNWLEEQLESRGIDAVVYTRYILSLLHSHTVDVLYPEEDLQFNHSHSKKEVRRSNKGFIGSPRSSSNWWKDANADAERIKRSAAVECLLSASEQNCEVESLVDELCEKLKELNSESAFPILTPPEVFNEISVESKKLTPQELAEKYYAAFPPLCLQSPIEQSKLLSLMPKWRNTTSTSSSSISSPIKKKSGKKTYKFLGYGNRSCAKETTDAMKSHNQNKQRLNCLARNRNLRNGTAFNNWDLGYFTSNKRFSNFRQKEERIQAAESFDQCIEDIWNNDGEMKLYDDLPVDIMELLDSPRPSNNTVEMMNIANMRDTGKRRFIPYGTSIMSSIWSTDQGIQYDNNFNSAIDVCSRANTDTPLTLEFSTISIDNPSAMNESFDDWPPANTLAENKTNTLFENNKNVRRRLFSNEFCNILGDRSSQDKDWNLGKEMFESEKLLAFSLMKLNHNKEKSSFRVLSPRSTQSKPCNPFGKSSSTFNFDPKYNDITEHSEMDDLLTSERSHFKPICDKIEKEMPQPSKYADGATFLISNTLEKVDYKRSVSGTMCLETELGQSKKYYEYKSSTTTPSPDLQEFIPKFIISENDKACQTENSAVIGDMCQLANCETAMSFVESTLKYVPYTEEDRISHVQQGCTCPNNATSASITTNSTPCPLHVIQRPESMLGEVLWQDDERYCEKCSNNNLTWSNKNWSTDNKEQADPDWNENGLRSIWSEVCHKCLAGGNLPRRAPNHQLREDISQDGEQLLTDLSIIQKSYMDDLPDLAERSLDISEWLSSGAISKERKRRHSLTIDHTPDVWSFASRLQEDCLIQKAALPALRAVTL